MNSEKIRELIDTFIPHCMKCNKDLSDIDTDKTGYDCPNCNYSIVKSAIEQMEVHFKGIGRDELDFLKNGILREFKGSRL